MIQMVNNESTASAKGTGNGNLGVYPLKYKNCRRTPSPKSFKLIPRNLGSKKSKEDLAITMEEDVYDTVDKVPRMELLKINYINLSKNTNILFKGNPNPTEQTKKRNMKSSTSSSTGAAKIEKDTEKVTKKLSASKYTVYKKHNLFGNNKDADGPKDKHAVDWDNDQTKRSKKYLLFDTKKRSKLENIQFYFDNKSYERHVDNKIYGCTGGTDVNLNNKPKRKHSWKELTKTQFGNVKQLQSRYEKNSSNQSKSVIQTSKSDSDDLVLREKIQRQTALSDINRISLMFLEARRGSLDDKLMERFQSNISKTLCEEQVPVRRCNEKTDKIKRLVENFENKCSCSDGSSDVDGRENFILGKSNLIADKSRLRHNQRISLPSENTILKNNLNGNNNNSSNKSNQLWPDKSSGALNHRDDVCRTTEIGTKSTGSSFGELVKRKNETGKVPPMERVTRSFHPVPRRERPLSMPSVVVLDKILLDSGKSCDSKKSCGYKNCNFVNCPMSASSSSGCNTSSSHSISSSESSDDNSMKKVSKTRLNCSPVLSRKESTRNNFNIPRSKTELQLNDKNHRSVNIIGEIKKGKFQSEKRNEKLQSIKQLESKIVTKYISEELKLISDKEKLNNERNREISLRDSYERYAEIKSDNTVKIYIPSPPMTENLGHSDASSIISDSDKDYGYYDQVTESVSSQESSTSKCDSKERIKIAEELTQHQPKNQEKSLAIKKVMNFKREKKSNNGVLGCDGAIFWNDCYFYDEKTCGAREKCIEKEITNRYVCVCRKSKKIDGLDSRPRSMEGPPDSGISLSGDTTNSDNPNCSQSDETCRLKRGHVLAELLETERIYVAEMGSILKGYRDQIFSEEMASLVPPGLQGKEDVLFGNLNELHSFHSDVFLKDLENCISTTELVALCFVQRRDTFYRLYSYYCQNIPRSEQLRETLVDTHLFLQECQKRLGHKLPLAAYLLKPVQRITKYQLLLKDLLRFSDNGTCAKELQKALDCMLIVLKCVNDSMHQIAITGFPADLDHQGELLLQDSFQVWTDSKKDLRLRLKTQQRHIFLYQKAMLFCKQASKTGHNKSTYQYKHYVKMSQIGLTESVRGDPRKFEVWLQGRLEVHTIQAATVEIKNKWVTEIKRVLLNQLEELKGEKIKQYGLNQKPLKHATSWEASVSITSLPQRAVSVDVGHDHKISSHHINVSNLEAIHNLPPAISSSSSEMDNQETGAWSSDYSNSEDEYTHIEDGVCVAPGGKFVALADYCAMGNSEVTMKEGDMVELVKVGCAGWWFVKVLGGSVEGWAPAAYLESLNRRPTRNRRSQDRLNDY